MEFLFIQGKKKLNFNFKFLLRSFQPLAGVFAGVVAFASAKLFFKTFSPTIFGITKTKNDEFETAFNTWVYYKNELEKKQ